MTQNYALLGMDAPPYYGSGPFGHILPSMGGDHAGPAIGPSGTGPRGQVLPSMGGRLPESPPAASGLLGGYGQQALAMANPQYNQMRPMSQLGALGPEPNYGSGGGGGGGGNDWSSLLGLAARYGLDNNNLIGDLANRARDYFSNGGTISPELAAQAHTGAIDTTATNAWIDGELANQAAPELAEMGGEALLGSGAGGMGALVSSVQPSIQAGIAATHAATEAALLGQTAPVLAETAVGGTAATGAGAGAGAGAAGWGTALGVAGLAALPIALGMAGVYGDPLQDQQSQLKRAYQGLGITPIRTLGGQDLLMLPNGEFIAARGVTSTLDDRFGKESQESLMNWLNSQARVDYRIPTLERNDRRED